MLLLLHKYNKTVNVLNEVAPRWDEDCILSTQFVSLNDFVYVAQWALTSSSWNTARSADAALLGKAKGQPAKGTLQSSRLLAASMDISITNRQGRANSAPAYRQHWHFNHWQLRTEWKTTVEFVLMHHHCLRLFNVLCNCPVTTQESCMCICFCAVKEAEKQISPAVTSLQMLTLSVGVMLLLFSSIWSQKM